MLLFIGLWMSEIEKAIRFGLDCNNHSMLLSWLIQPENKDFTNKDWDISVNQFNVLLETIADELVCSQWRCWCLDNINRPLFRLERHAQTAEQQLIVKLFYHELRLISHYVSAGLNRTSC